MKSDIHPQWYPNAKVTCSCGHIFTIGMSKPEIRVEICSACHPFFTGQMTFVDTLGRVEKFQKKQKLAEASADKMAEKRLKKKEREEQLRNPKSLKDMLMGLRG